MNTAQWEIESRETVGLKTCNDCSREIREGDRFCRRCGADQNGRAASAAPDAMEAELKYRTSRLPETDNCRRFSGSLVKSLVEGASVRTAPINNRFAKLVVSMLAAAALWLMIVLLAPFDAYVAARSIANNVRLSQPPCAETELGVEITAMSKVCFVKLLIIFSAVVLIGLVTVKTVQARPEYLKIFAANTFSRPELRNKCSVCHVNPAGGGERNAFGKAFAAAGFEVTAELRRQFPDRFLSEGEKQNEKPPVSLVQGSDSEAVVEINGKRYAINMKEKTVNELAPDPAPEKDIAAAPPAETQEERRPGVYRQVDVRLINLPTATPIAKGSLWTDFTHRFPFANREPEDLFGLDSFAIPSFGFIYGVTGRIHVGAYRSSAAVGRPILLYAGASLLDEHKGAPLSLMARVGLEGRDNFKRNFTTSFELTFARSITRHAQVYLAPTVSVGDRPMVSPEVNAPGETAAALGIGAAVNVRPSVALLAEANYRLNKESRYINGPIGIRRPVFGFGIQKASVSRRHAFSLVFTNGAGTTFAQRSMTNGLFTGDDGFNGLTIGFNLSRRLF